MTKAEFRRTLRERLRAPDETRGEKSRAIAAFAAAHPALARSRCIALFSALPTEPDLSDLLKLERRRFCYPRVTGEQMDFVEVQTLGDLLASSWHPAIREPSSSITNVVSPAEIDLIFVPALAYSKDGHRLGQGGGFYDRYLPKLSSHAVKIGICFAMQIFDAVPGEAHDQNVDAIITEEGLIEPTV